MQETNKDLWNAQLYDGKHAFISNYGNDVIELLNPMQGEKILDVGCGTGDLVNVLHGLGVHVTGIDYSENMVALAAAKYPHIAFEVADAANLPFHEQFPWYFPTIGAYTTLLESAGFHVGLALHFARPTKLEGEDGLKNWLAMFSPSIFEDVAVETKEHIFNTTVENVRESLYRDGQWFADYKRLRVVAVKK